MILGVFSDSHGNFDYLENAASYAIRKGGAEVLAHLGDNYGDATALSQFGKRVIRVPGVFSQQYQDISISNRIVETFGNWNVLMSHTAQKHPNDLASDLDPLELARSRTIHILLHGHTHEPRIEQRDGIWLINPGHLRQHDKKGHPASFGLLEFGDANATARIIELRSHNEVQRADFALRQL